MTKELRVMQQIAEVLKGIDGSGDYSFDIGERVYRGRLLFDDDDNFPVLTVRDNGASNESNANISSRAKISKSFSVHGIVDVSDTDNPNDEAYLLIGDIKRAIFNGDERLSGNSITLTYTGSSVSALEDSVSKIGCSVDLTVIYAENLLTP